MQKSNKTLLERLYIVNFILLSLHEMDAIHWREWELLLGIYNPAVGLPVFILAHIPLYGLLLFGLLRLDSLFGRRLSLVFSGLLIVHFAAHAIVLAVTGTFMHSALSAGILIGTALAAPAQFLVTMRSIRDES